VAARLLWTYYRAVKAREGLLMQPATAPKAVKRTKPAQPKRKRGSNGR
jgi:hypothetical protein